MPLRALAKRALALASPGHSYSLYAEDALLFAALGPTKRGFYVDVGAHSPVEGSNTYRLYRRGWRGITVEPNPDVAPSFRKRRARDIHVAEGVSMEAGALEYHRFQNTVMNTFSPERAAHITQLGEVSLGSYTIKTRPLAQIIREYAPDARIDLLSVDCEGLDLDVLRSANLGETQPTFVVVEDLPGYYAFRDQGDQSKLQHFMSSVDYRPVAQAFYSTIYAAKDWRRLNSLSGAFNLSQPSLLPLD